MVTEFGSALSGDDAPEPTRSRCGPLHLLSITAAAAAAATGIGAATGDWIAAVQVGGALVEVLRQLFPPRRR